MKKILLALLILLSLKGYAQFSKTHYIPPLSNSQNISADEQFLYISTPSLTPVNFRIINIGGAVINGTVSRDIPYVHAVGFGSGTQLMAPSGFTNNVLANKGYIVEAEDMVYVTVRVMATNSFHAGALVSKGLAALGTQFRVGALTNNDAPAYSASHYTFVSVLATENNTQVTFSNLKPGIQLLNNEFSDSTPVTVTLNSGESYILAVQGPHEDNRDALIGALVESDKPIAMACGSFGGTNGEMGNIDLGFDQAVPAERTGKEYIFIKSTGMAAVERVLLVAHEDDTEIFLNGNPGSTYTIDAGEYVALTGNQYSAAGNLYVRTSKNVFAYQGIGDDSQPNQANQEMFFVPPLSCQTPKIIDNIPLVNQVGSTIFTGRVTLVTEAGSDIDFVLDGVEYTLADLPSGIFIDGPLNVVGKPGFVTYTITGLTGNVSVYSTTQLYLASYGTFVNATFGGFYSGFTFKPAISFEQIDLAQPDCLPNIQLSVSEAAGFDTYEWFYNDELVSTAFEYIPTQPGYYYVAATLAACGTTLQSDRIPVSVCETDMDDDGAADNFDIDNDNDGITNCDESYGNLNLNLANPFSGTFAVGDYTNSFTGSFPTATGPVAATPFVGFSNGNFVTETAAGPGNSVIYQVNFGQPASVMLDYVDTAAASDLLNADAEFIVNSDNSQTLTILNPDNQLLIDTNYDGFYESGVTHHTSFEIRFRLNSTTPLAPGSGTFSLQTYLATSIKITHINLTEAVNKATFRLRATCIPRDSDGDGIDDHLDFDSDNDSIPDVYESQAENYTPLTGTDSDGNGLDDAFGTGISPADSDADGVPDFLDLDSDNDGIYDVIESGTTSASNNGVLTSPSFGSNGLANNIETTPDSGILNFEISDTDNNGIINAIDSDSDGDLCSDVREAGFIDGNNNGYLGNSTSPTVNSNGLVTGAGGYTLPDPNYLTPVPIEIIDDVTSEITICENENASLSIVTNAGVAFQWQVSTNEISFTDLPENATYSGVNSATLTINNVSAAMDGYIYRVMLSKAGNVCGSQSGETTLHINPLPPVVTQTLVQCDTGPAPDGITLFNLSQADSMFTNGSTDISLEYYETIADAESGAAPLNNAYTNISSPQQIVVKVTNAVSGCSNFSRLNLVANILPSPVVNLPEQCDTDGIEDGFYEFNLTGPFGATVRYYETETDALLEQNEISNPSSYVNTSAYQTQTIFVRHETANDCASISLLNIVVKPLPDINANLDLEPHVVCVNSLIFTTTIDAALQDGSAPEDYSYQWFYEGTAIPGATGYTHTLSTEGTYSVLVTNSDGCTKIRTVPVIASSSAIIESVSTTEFLDNNSVTVTLTENSYGNYVYSLDYPNAYQESNVFTNVRPGFHTVYVKDMNGCTVTTQLISVLGIPKYFTPNGDGYHDTWNIQGVGYAFHPNTITYIYDRYGKLLKQLSASGAGWDGTFNGAALPSNDYWYVIVMDDGRIFRGHFALKR